MLAGVAYMKQREPDFGNAIGELRKSVHEYKRNPQARYLLGICYVQINHAKDAKDFFREAIKTQDDTRVAAEYCRTLARLHIALGEYDDAAAVLCKGATLQPYDYETRFQYAVVLATLGDLDGAASEVQGTMLADTLYEARTGLVPELTTIYRDRVRLLHKPIAEGADPPTYEACLQYGRMAIELGEHELAWAYLVHHLRSYDIEDHVRRFDRLLSLPCHPATTGLLRHVLESPRVDAYLHLPALLNVVRKLLDTYGVNPGSAISAYSLDALLGAWRAVLVLPEVIRAQVISRVANDSAFGNVPLAGALDRVVEVRRLGLSYAEAAGGMLSWHVRSLSSRRSAPTIWVVLDRLARTGCKEYLRTTVEQMLRAKDWLEDMAYWSEGASVRSVTGLSEREVERALKLYGDDIERRIAAVRNEDPALAAAVARRLTGKIGYERLLAAIPPSNGAWADAAFRRALFASAAVDSSIDHFLRLFSSLPKEIVVGAAVDFAAVARLEKATTTLAAIAIALITELFKKPLSEGGLEPLFYWLEPMLVRHVVNAVRTGKFETCALRPTTMRASWFISDEAVGLFIQAAQKESNAMTGPLRSLEFDVDAWRVLKDNSSKRRVIAAVQSVAFQNGQWNTVARAAHILVSVGGAPLAEDVIRTAMRQIGRSDSPNMYELEKLPPSKTTAKLCVDAVKRGGVASSSLDDLVARLLASGAIRPAHTTALQWAIVRRKVRDFFH